MMPEPLLFSSFPIAQMDFSSFPSQAEIQKGIDDRNAAITDAVKIGQTVESGWIPPDRRTTKENLAHVMAMADVPRLKLVGKSINENVTKVGLWECWTLALGRPYLGVHQIEGSCFPAGTAVRMGDGSEKSVEDVVVGDDVVTHTGGVRSVVETMRRDFDGVMVRVRVVGFDHPLTMTADHRVAVVSRSGRMRPRWPSDILRYDLTWKRADELSSEDHMVVGLLPTDQDHPIIDMADVLGDRCIVLDDLMASDQAPVSNIAMAQYVCRNSGVDWRGRVKLVKTHTDNAVIRHIRVTSSLGRLVGLYLAEGGVSGGRVIFTLSHKEDHLADEIISLVSGIFGVSAQKYIQHSRPTVLNVRVSNCNVATFFRWLCPANVYDKRVPGIFMRAGVSTKLALLSGWMDGDGYTAVKKVSGKNPQAVMQGVTVSSGLARDMTTLAISCGVRSSYAHRKARGHSRVAYDVHLYGGVAAGLSKELKKFRRNRPKADYLDPCFSPYGYMRRVKDIEVHAVSGLPVYDFEVEEDHSFVAGGLVVHNCVGAGGGNALFSLAAADKIKRKDHAKVSIPFWLLPYGISRMLGGMNDRGSGSFGSTFSEAVGEYGHTLADEEGLPKYQEGDGIIWGGKAELDWSQGKKIEKKWLDKAKPHLVRSRAVCRTIDDVRDAIKNYFPVTIASNWGGLMQCPVKGEPGVLLNRRSGTWMHQMSVQGWWDHPTFGELFYVLNQWGLGAHGTCPSGAPRGGFWITKKEMKDIVDQDEAIAFSQFDDFPAVDEPLDFGSF